MLPTSSRSSHRGQQQQLSASSLFVDSVAAPSLFESPAPSTTTDAAKLQPGRSAAAAAPTFSGAAERSSNRSRTDSPAKTNAFDFFGSTPGPLNQQQQQQQRQVEAAARRGAPPSAASDAFGPRADIALPPPTPQNTLNAASAAALFGTSLPPPNARQSHRPAALSTGTPHSTLRIPSRTNAANRTNVADLFLQGAASSLPTQGNQKLPESASLFFDSNKTDATATSALFSTYNETDAAQPPSPHNRSEAEIERQQANTTHAHGYEVDQDDDLSSPALNHAVNLFSNAASALFQGGRNAAAAAARTYGNSAYNGSHSVPQKLENNNKPAPRHSPPAVTARTRDAETLSVPIALLSTSTSCQSNDSSIPPVIAPSSPFPSLSTPPVPSHPTSTLCHAPELPVVLSSMTLHRTQDNNASEITLPSLHVRTSPKVSSKRETPAKKTVAKSRIPPRTIPKKPLPLPPPRRTLEKGDVFSYPTISSPHITATNTSASTDKTTGEDAAALKISSSLFRLPPPTPVFQNSTPPKVSSRAGRSSPIAVTANSVHRAPSVGDVVVPTPRTDVFGSATIAPLDTTNFTFDANDGTERNPLSADSTRIDHALRDKVEVMESKKQARSDFVSPDFSIDAEKFPAVDESEKAKIARSVKRGNAEVTENKKQEKAVSPSLSVEPAVSPAADESVLIGSEEVGYTFNQMPTKNSTLVIATIINHSDQSELNDYASNEASSVVLPQEIVVSTTAIGRKTTHEPTTKETTTSKSNEKPASAAASAISFYSRHPPPPPAVVLSMPLPPGWMELAVPDTGKTYYFNETTGVTTWERPFLVGPSLPFPPVSSSALDDTRGTENIASVIDTANVELDEGRSTVASISQAEMEIGNDTANEAVENISTMDTNGSDTYLGPHTSNDLRDSSNHEAAAAPELTPVPTPHAFANAAVEHESAHEAPNETDSDSYVEVTAEDVESYVVDNVLAGRKGPDGTVYQDANIASSALEQSVQGLSDFPSDLVNDMIALQKNGDLANAEDQVTMLEYTDLIPEPNKQTLPEGWVELIEPQSGRSYYYNEARHVASWEHPFDSPLIEPEIESAIPYAADGDIDISAGMDSHSRDAESVYDSQPEDLQVPHNNFLVDLTPTESAVEGVAGAVGAELTLPESSLPHRWVEATDPSSGTIYYYNENDGSSSWEKPVVAAAISVDGDEHAQAIPGDVGVSDEDDDWRDKYTEPDSTNSKSHQVLAAEKTDVEESERLEFFGAAHFADGDLAEPETVVAPANNELLPSEWVEHDDTVSDNMTLSETLRTTATKLQESDHENNSHAKEGANSAIEYAPMLDTKLSSDIDDKLHHEATDESFTVESSLLPGWIEFTDSTSGMKYYYCEFDGSTTWEKPVVAADSAEGSEHGTKVLPNNSDIGNDDKASRVDDDESWGDNFVETIESDLGAMAGMQQSEDGQQPKPIKDSAVLSACAESENREPESDLGPVADEKLPPGWVELKDAASGALCYFNAAKNTTLWEKPVYEFYMSETIPENVVTIDYASEQAANLPDTVVQPEEVQEPNGVVETNFSSESENPVESEVDAKLNVASHGPHGWIASHDEISGLPSYANEQENLTTVDEESKVKGELSSATASNAEVKSQPFVFGDNDSAEKKMQDETPQIVSEAVQAVSDDAVSLLKPTFDGNSSVESKPDFPHGWIELTDSSSGLSYYYNQAENITSWDRPPAASLVLEDTVVSVAEYEGTDAFESVKSDAITGEEESALSFDDARDDISENITVTREGHEELSNFLDEKSASSTDLLPGWVELIDSSSGKRYYFNENECLTSWQKPTKAATESNENLQKSGEQVPIGDSETRKNADLGAGLESLLYINDEPDETPKLASGREEGSFPIFTEAQNEFSNGTDDLTYDSTQPKPALTASDDSLPPGWAELIDPLSGNVYYYNEYESVSSWEKPTTFATKNPEENCIEGVGFPNNDAEYDDTTGQLQNVCSELQPTAVSEAVKISEAVASVAKELEGDSVAKDELLPGWVQMLDSITGEAYYYHEQDNATSWEIPTIVAIKFKKGNTEDISMLEEHTPVTTSNTTNEIVLPAKLGTVEYALSDGNEKSPELVYQGPLPTGWTEVMDPSSGTPYYFHEVDNVTSWEKPNQIDDNVVKSAEESRMRATKNDGSTGELTFPSKNIALPPIDAGESPESAKTTEDLLPIDDGDVVLSGPGSEPELPPGWVIFTDSASETPYYYNEFENKTSWERPSLNSALSDETKIVGAEKQAFSDDHSKTDEVMGKAKLPLGWIEIADTDSGTPYYFNEVQNITTWDRPFCNEDLPNQSRVTPTATTEDIDVASSNTATLTAKFLNRQRPAHALASFGFGGRVCVMFPQVAARLSGTNKLSDVAPDSTPFSFRKGPVVIHRLSGVLPANQILVSQSNRHVDADGIVTQSLYGPLNSCSDSDVLSHLERKAKSSDVAKWTQEELLWNLVFIAAKWKGRLRSGGGASDPQRPEAAIVNLILQGDQPNGSTMLRKHNQDIVSEGESKTFNTSSSLDEIQNLILWGKREEAVASALSSKDFALALLIASMCDRATYQIAARHVADEALYKGSALHTYAMLCSEYLQHSDDEALGIFWNDDAHELNQNWRYHLATLLSNRTQGWERIVLTLGDRLLQLGNIHSAHFCYMVCGCSITYPTHPSSRLVLLGCDHTIPMHTALMTPEGVESYERTEAFEWAKRKGNPQAAIPALQPVKLKYAMLLADLGYEQQAKMYIDSIRQCTGIDRNRKNEKATKSRRLSSVAMAQPPGFAEALDVFEDRLNVLLAPPPLPPRRVSGTISSILGALGSVSSVISKSSQGGAMSVEASSAPANPQVKISKPNTKANVPSHPIAAETPLCQTMSAEEPVIKKLVDQEPSFQHESDSTKAQPRGSQSVTRKLNHDLDDDVHISFVSALSSTLDATMLTARETDCKAESLAFNMSGKARTTSSKVLDASIGSSSKPVVSMAETNFPLQHTGGTSKEVLLQNTLIEHSTPNLTDPRDVPSGFRSAPSSVGANIATNAKAQNTFNDKPNSSLSKVKSPSTAPVGKKPREQVSAHAAKRSWSISSWITKKLNPDATQADPGRSMEAYYDEKLKRWIFPGDDPAEVAKPLAPPPITPSQIDNSIQKPIASPAPNSNDPLASLMAPPSRPPSALRSGGVLPSMQFRHAAPPTGARITPSTRVPNSPANGQNFPSMSLASGSQVPPQFAIFEPSATATVGSPLTNQVQNK